MFNHQQTITITVFRPFLEAYESVWTFERVTFWSLLSTSLLCLHSFAFVTLPLLAVKMEAYQVFRTAKDRGMGTRRSWDNSPSSLETGGEEMISGWKAYHLQIGGRSTHFLCAQKFKTASLSFSTTEASSAELSWYQSWIQYGYDWDKANDLKGRRAHYAISLQYFISRWFQLPQKRHSGQSTG